MAIDVLYTFAAILK